MSKVLEIVGASRKLIIDDCAKCPLQYRISGYREECHHPDLEGRFAESGSICYLCPLPDAHGVVNGKWPDDDNHRLGPNGEPLEAVEVDDTTVSKCFVCFYGVNARRNCPAKIGDTRCSSRFRKDGKSIVWKLAGERK